MVNIIEYIEKNYSINDIPYEKLEKALKPLI